MRASKTVFLFGAAEKGEVCAPLYLDSMQQLFDCLGNPPENTEGVRCAIQTVLFEHHLIFYRVTEEGFSLDEYIRGLRWLRQKPLKSSLQAICMPGVGDPEIIQAALPICHIYHSILLFSEKDSYDYLTTT